MKYLALKKILQLIERVGGEAVKGNVGGVSAVKIVSGRAFKQAKTENGSNWDSLRDRSVLLRGEKTREKDMTRNAGCSIKVGYPVFYSKRGVLFG